ncbi:MAG: peptidoglycan editing factor PgeF [Castellaniella sp.]|uniref:peptidoglycan editing factor PgeF n=1 Tax=Castellaniella sp. TaxID=1955812 RepID=UPI002A3632E9|nr:peptidoglycan editing factor PgeF [Castellaniella sp.]MDY0309146.1 peptidoglycan editing factor PgeF [Castellaniella sp.]
MVTTVLELAPELRGVTGAPWPGVRYFSTWRTGGISRAPRDSLNLGAHVGDDPEAVRENRRRVQRALPGEPLWLDQVHGTAVFDGDVDTLSAPCADAAVTTLPDRPLAILTADCLPVVLADGAGTVLGVAHAGWRGLAAGVLENTLDLMRRRAPAANGWRAWIGPGIGSGAFQVGPDVRMAFLDRDPELAECFVLERQGGDRWLADLAGLARARLSRAGVKQVESSGECTWTRADRYFSHRRDPGSGRQATLAYLTSSDVSQGAGGA